MNDFNSLTLLLQPWFDKPLSELPDEVRQRIKQDFLPPWDALSPDQRREAALQIDYQRDPATEEDRQHWWNLTVRRESLEKDIAAWEATATPTASDLAHKEARLAELRNELDQLGREERKPQRPYIPSRAHSTQSPAEGESQAPTRYLAYPKALQSLSDRLNATAEELAAWIFMGPEHGGLAAYIHANELEPPPRFFYGNHVGAEDYMTPLMATWFRQEDIVSFQPAERFITGKALIERWGKNPGIQPEAFIAAKIAESRLVGMNPTFGGTNVTFPEWDNSPPLETDLFAMSHIVAIEAEDGVVATILRPEGKESPEGRRQRIQARVAELKARKVKNFLETVAEEEGVSASRIKQIIYDSPKPALSTAKAPANPWAGLDVAKRQPSQNKAKSQ